MRDASTGRRGWEAMIAALGDGDDDSHTQYKYTVSSVIMSTDADITDAAAAAADNIAGRVLVML